MKIILLCMLFTALTIAQEDAILKLFPGKWKMETDKSEFYEEWKVVEETELVGESYSVDNGVEAINEILYLKKFGDQWAYVAVPEGQNISLFALVEYTPKKFIFENKEHDFPHRISYEFHKEGKLTAAIEGEVDGEFMRKEFSFMLIEDQPLMLLRIAEETDYPEIIKIYNHAIDEKFATADTDYLTIESRKEWFALHSPKTYPIYIAEENSQVIGWCSLSPHRPGRKGLRTVAEISYYIHKDHRRKGVANLLITDTIKSAKELGFKNLISILLDLNKTSIYILEKFGFKIWGHLPNVADINGVVCGQFIYGKRI